MGNDAMVAQEVNEGLFLRKVPRLEYASPARTDPDPGNAVIFRQSMRRLPCFATP